MGNKSSLTNALLAIIIILLVAVLFYLIPNNFKKGGDEQIQDPASDTTLTPVSITKSKPKTTPTPIPTPEPKPNDNVCATTIGNTIEQKYSNMKCQNPAIKYDTYSRAVSVFKMGTHPNMEAIEIVSYVPGKLPHEDGDPYFYGRGIVNELKNDCIVGYMNLITGAIDSHHDVCVIYN